MRRFADPNKSQLKDPEATCIHHWKLEAPAGGVTRGQCAKCGAARRFLEPPQPEFGRHRPRQ